jgi:hypothetical protein
MKVFNELIVLQGTTAKWSIRIANQSGTPIDLTNVTLKGQIRTTYNSPIIEAGLNFEMVDAPQGAVYMYLNPTQSEALTTNRYVFDVEASEPISSGAESGSVAVYRILEGSVIVRPRVTI